MSEKIIDLWDKVLDFFFPKSEIIAELERLAKANSLGILPNPYPEPYHYISSLFSYRDRKVRALVWAIKYKGNIRLAEAVGRLIYENIVDEIGEKILFEKFAKIILIPIPAGRKHLEVRGFNQTEIIAEAIKRADETDMLQLGKNILTKIRETEPQTKLPRHKRMKNLNGAFAARSVKEIDGSLSILIDDVATTGSTLREARRALLAAGAKKVIAFTIAH